MNVHLMSHLTYFAEAWGPLWTMSCFSFESANGTLRRYFHGSRNMSVQVKIQFIVYIIWDSFRENVVSHNYIYI